MNAIKRVGVLFVSLLFVCGCMGRQLSTVKLTVVDDDGQVVEDATVVLGFNLARTETIYRGSTNSDGQVRSTKFEALGTSYNITKEGYYRTGGQFSSGSKNEVVILREKKNPIAMYAIKTYITPGEEGFDKWVSYDFSANDFLPPIGLGIYEDVRFKIHHERIDMWNFTYNVEIQFPNEGDGLITFGNDHHPSTFLSDYNAPTSGYQQSWSFYQNRNGVGTPIETNLDRFRNYYFRIRTQLDENGEVTSALYGKIYGEFPTFTYYLNPNDNDRNVEFDPTQNLFRGLSQDERPFEP